MTREEAKYKIEEISEQLRVHNHSYYVLSESAISDFDFDMLLEEYKN